MDHKVPSDGSVGHVHGRANWLPGAGLWPALTLGYTGDGVHRRNKLSPCIGHSPRGWRKEGLVGEYIAMLLLFLLPTIQRVAAARLTTVGPTVHSAL